MGRTLLDVTDLVEFLHRGPGARSIDQQRRLGDLERQHRRVDAIRAQVLIDTLREFRVEQVVRRQIHREAEVIAAIVDLPEAPDATTEHQVGELLDQAGVLCDPDELRRRDHAAD